MPSRGDSLGFSSATQLANASGLRDWSSTRPGPKKSNTQPSPDFIDWIDRPCDGAAHLEPHVERVRDDMPGVDGDDLAVLEVDDVDRAVDADQRLTLPAGAETETTLAAEQVRHPAPLGVDLDAGGVRDPAPATQEERLLRRDVDRDGVTRAARRRRRPSRPAAGAVYVVTKNEPPPSMLRLQAGHDAALRLGLQLHAGAVGDHGAALDPHGSPAGRTGSGRR